MRVSLEQGVPLGVNCVWRRKRRRTGRGASGMSAPSHARAVNADVRCAFGGVLGSERVGAREDVRGGSPNETCLRAAASEIDPRDRVAVDALLVEMMTALMSP